MQIPKILHYIWIGPYSKPNYSFINSWREHMPEYTIMEWTNSNPVLKKYLEEIIDSCGGIESLNDSLMGYVGAILRHLILRDYGGVYMDHDVMILKNLTPLLSGHRLVLSYQHDPANYQYDIVLPKGTDITNMVQYGKNHLYESSCTMNDCFIATVPQHIFTKNCIEQIVANHKLPKEQQVPATFWSPGPHVMTNIIESFGYPQVRKCIPIDSEDVCVYPMELLHPLRWNDRSNIGPEEYHRRFRQIIESDKSYAVHYHEHFGASMYMKKQIITFGPWYTNWLSTQSNLSHKVMA